MVGTGRIQELGAVMASDEKLTCVICGSDIDGYGNNPAPIVDSGRCCDRCNLEVVIPSRIEALSLSGSAVD